MISRLSKYLQNISSQQLITNQKTICYSIIKIYKNFKRNSFSTNLCQLNFTKLLQQKVYKRLKQAIESSAIKQDQIISYQYIFSRPLFSPLFIRQQLFKSSTQLYYQIHTKPTRYINQILQNFKKQKMQILPACLNQYCQISYFNWTITKQDQQKILITSINFQQNINNQKLQKILINNICCLLNSAYNGAALLIGLNQQYKITGVKMTILQIDKFVKLIKQIRNKYIFPKLQQTKQILQINVIKIQDQLKQKLTYKYDNKFGQFSQYNNNNINNIINNISNTYVIKIYANTECLFRNYFVMKQYEDMGKLKYQYYLWKDPKKQATLSEKVYFQIHHSYCKKKSTKFKSKRNIKVSLTQKNMKLLSSTMINQQPPHQQQQLQIQHIKNDQFGRVPQKYYTYHSLLIVGPKGQQMLSQFYKVIQNQVAYKMYHIYEKMINLSNRKVFYFTHRRNQQQLCKIVANIDKNRSQLLFLKIKNQITMLRQQIFPKAYKVLKQKYENYFQEKLQVVYKRDSLNANTLQYFFKFNSDEKAIFSFMALQASDIRGNFANPSKLKGCISIQNLPNFKI